MAAFLPDAWIVDAIIALVAVEAIVLVVWRALNWRRPSRSGNSREFVVRRSPPVGPAHGDHRRLVSLCSGLAVGCAHRSCRRSREPMGSGASATSIQGFVRMVTKIGKAL